MEESLIPLVSHLVINRRKCLEEMVEDPSAGLFHMDNVFPLLLLSTNNLLTEFNLLRTMDNTLHGSEDMEEVSTE